jgi:Domain of unknown function (DUF5658)
MSAISINQGLPSVPPVPLREVFRRPCQFLSIHAWFLALAALDVVLTTIILGLGGHEANGIARAVIATGGLSAMVLFKVACVVVALVLCEVVGHRKPRTGRGIALAAVGLNTTAVSLGIAYLAIYSLSAYL